MFKSCLHNGQDFEEFLVKDMISAFISALFSIPNVTLGLFILCLISSKYLESILIAIFP